MGYSIGSSEKIDVALTRIKYMTDCVLLKETMRDPLLSKYNVVIIDEVHESSLASELILSIVKRLGSPQK